MTDKQKKTLTRILVTFAIFAVLFVLEHMGKLENVNTFVLLIIYLVPYLIIGYDIILKAVKNISHGQVFDENFLMMVATVRSLWRERVLRGRSCYAVLSGG